MLGENLAKYFEKARQEGRQEGRVQTLRKVLLQQMTLRTSTQELEKLTRKVVRVKSLQEMGLG